MLSRYLVSQVKHNSFFLVGLFLGLWVSLAVIPLDEEPAACMASVGSVSPTTDEFEPQREEKLLGSGGQAAGRSIQRPRYYSTELGMRASLLTGVLSSEDALKLQVAALNHTAALLQPALKFFITANAMSVIPGLANVVGFTDTREMLKPFHALKYLADNFLEEYDFFFLVSDKSFVNARRLTELVSKLSISQDVYMGKIAEDDSHYCSLESGIIMSNSVLRAVHNELDWCVRNSYSPHHHENIGRCVLHAAHLSCTPALQGESYSSVHIDPESISSALSPALADAVTVCPVTLPTSFHQLHAYISRVFLERDHEEVLKLRGYLWHNTVRHPPGYRNNTWPGGLRGDVGIAPPLPDNRFDHLRWTTFNATHAFMPDDHRTVGALTGANKLAVDLVVQTARSWAMQRWPSVEDVSLVEGAWCWQPAIALRYRLTIKLTPTGGANTHTLRQIEVVRPLGAARLVPVRYVTESAKVAMVLPLIDSTEHMEEAETFMQRYEAVCLGQDKNTALVVVILRSANENTTLSTPLRESITALASRHKGAQLDILDDVLDKDTGPNSGKTESGLLLRAGKIAFNAALQKVTPDSLVLLAVPHMDFNQDFINRVRMNTISGSQWYLPTPFARHSQYDHPRFLTPAGAKPQTNTGRFNLMNRHVVAFYAPDYDAALSQWRGTSHASVGDILAHSPLRCIRAPEPGLVLSPRPNPCKLDGDKEERQECLARLRDEDFSSLDLGAKHSLAQLLLETQAELDS